MDMELREILFLLNNRAYLVEEIILWLRRYNQESQSNFIKLLYRLPPRMSNKAIQNLGLKKKYHRGCACKKWRKLIHPIDIYDVQKCISRDWFSRRDSVNWETSGKQQVVPVNNVVIKQAVLHHTLRVEPNVRNYWSDDVQRKRGREACKQEGHDRIANVDTLTINDTANGTWEQLFVKMTTVDIFVLKNFHKKLRKRLLQSLFVPHGEENNGHMLINRLEGLFLTKPLLPSIQTTSEQMTWILPKIKTVKSLTDNPRIIYQRNYVGHRFGFGFGNTSKQVQLFSPLGQPIHSLPKIQKPILANKELITSMWGECVIVGVELNPDGLKKLVSWRASELIHLKITDLYYINGFNCFSTNYMTRLKIIKNIVHPSMSPVECYDYAAARNMEDEHKRKLIEMMDEQMAYDGIIMVEPNDSEREQRHRGMYRYKFNNFYIDRHEPLGSSRLLIENNLTNKDVAVSNNEDNYLTTGFIRQTRLKAKMMAAYKDDNMYLYAFDRYQIKLVHCVKYTQFINRYNWKMKYKDLKLFPIELYFNYVKRIDHNKFVIEEVHFIEEIPNATLLNCATCEDLLAYISE